MGPGTLSRLPCSDAPFAAAQAAGVRLATSNTCTALPAVATASRPPSGVKASAVAASSPGTSTRPQYARSARLYRCTCTRHHSATWV